MKITGIEAARKACGTDKVTISGWAPGDEFEVELKRPTLMQLLRRNVIPNPLIASVEKLFAGSLLTVGETDEHHAEKLLQQAQSLEIMAEEALVSPTYQELKDAGVELNDNQMYEIWYYCCGGVAGLAEFRKRLRAAIESNGQTVE